MKKVENDIIALMKVKDKMAISMLYDHYSDALFGVVKRIVKEDDKAKDVMQDSFVKVWQNLDKYDSSKAKLFTWLLRIFRNTAIDHLRKINNLGSSNIQNLNGYVNMQSSLELNPDQIDISQHLSGINEKFRRVIEKVYMQGMTQCETSKALDIPLGTVKSRLRLGLSALRKIYVPSFILILIEIV